jgi:uncharacterized membrane protein YphA (DoxX/SURF4 family)
MKVLLQFVRIFVGVLFIFSGLVKANDPLGLSYKMQEFFEIWGWHGLNDWTLLSSVLMNAFEIIAGFALLVGWRIKLFSWLLLLLIIFFTYLTGYTYFTGQPKNCGCFGDCLPITSKTSFLKDVLLLILLGYLFYFRNKIKPLFSNGINTGFMLLITIVSFGMQWYALRYGPFVDCLPYKKGNNIAEKMKMPANAIQDSIDIYFVYDKQGKKVEFTAEHFPADFSDSLYTYVDRVDKVVKEGSNNIPPISGFALTTAEGADSTAIVLQDKYAVLLFAEARTTDAKDWAANFKKVYEVAKQKNIPVYIATSSYAELKTQLAAQGLQDITLFNFDNTAFRTAARTNPTLYVLNQGTIINKWSGKRMDNAVTVLEPLTALPAAVVPPVAVQDTVVTTTDTLQNTQP